MIKYDGCGVCETSREINLQIQFSGCRKGYNGISPTLYGFLPWGLFSPNARSVRVQFQAG